MKFYEKNGVKQELILEAGCYEAISSDSENELDDDCSGQ